MNLPLPFYYYLRTLILPLKEISSNLPKKGKIIDLGCGEGVIASYLAQNKTREVLGVDLDAKRLPKSKTENLKFTIGDIRKYNLKNAAGVILSDVLHHIDFQSQDKVLKNISKNLKPGGVLVIKEIDTQDFIRGKLSRFWDFVFYPNEKVYFNSSKVLVKKLKKLGFKVQIQKTTKFFPGSTTLFICSK